MFGLPSPTLYSFDAAGSHQTLPTLSLSLCLPCRSRCLGPSLPIPSAPWTWSPSPLHPSVRPLSHLWPLNLASPVVGLELHPHRRLVLHLVLAAGARSASCRQRQPDPHLVIVADWLYVCTSLPLLREVHFVFSVGHKRCTLARYRAPSEFLFPSE